MVGDLMMIEFGITENPANPFCSHRIGEWMKARGNRDEIVLATKFATGYPLYKFGKGKTVNYAGNHRRSLHMSIRDSLEKLQTDFIDILYLHW